MKFFGLREPKTDVPLIEIERSDGQILDLYNESWLQSVVVCADELSFKFIMADPVGSVATGAAVQRLLEESSAI